MTENENKNWAFLSFSPLDNPAPSADPQAGNRRSWGDWWHAALKTFAIPKEFVGQLNGRGEIIPERIAPIFRAEQALPEDAPLSATSRQALEQSICLIVICSPRSSKNVQVNEAVRYFKQLGRGQNILPIVIAGNPSGQTPDDECFVPALRHPVLPDGIIDTTRRAGKFIFVDARHGAEKREILAPDNRHAEADLAMAKIQLIALLLSVGFDGLWLREQKRHFVDLAEAQHQAQQARQQVEEIQRQAREAQNQALEAQNLPREVHGQIQAAQDQALAAQQQAHVAQQQLQEFQNKVRDTQSQLEEARSRALAAESKVLEAQQQAREIQQQLEATRQQASEAQSQVLEIQNRSPEIPGQLQAAQNQILEAQNEAQQAHRQLAETREQAQDAHNKFQAAQRQVQEFQNQAQSAESQLAAAREQVRAAESQVLLTQQQAREAQEKFQESQSQTRAAQSQLEEARSAACAVEAKLLEAQSQVRVAQNKIEESQTKSQTARRLTQVFAVLAVLALLAASFTGWPRKQVTPALGDGGLAREPIQQALQKIGGEEQARSLDQLAAGIPPAEIPAALAASAALLNDQQRSRFQQWLLVRLGWANPVSAMTNAGAIEGNIVNATGQSDSASYFQLAVLDNWMQTDLPAAFNWVCQLPDADFQQRALGKILPALNVSSDAAHLAALNQVVVNWSRQNPPAALQFASQHSKLFGAALGEITKAWFQDDSPAAPSAFESAELLPENIVPWSWTKLFLNAKVELIPVETDEALPSTNAPTQSQSPE